MFANNPDALIDEITALRFQWAREGVTHLRMLDSGKRKIKLDDLKISERFDDRLMAALYEAEEVHEEARKERLHKIRMAQLKARMAARGIRE